MKTTLETGGTLLKGILLGLLATALSGSAQHLRAPVAAAIGAPQVCTGGIIVSPASLNFGGIAIGKESAQKRGAVKNTNSCRVPSGIFISIASSADGGDFSQTNDCPAVLNAPDGCIIEVTFSPRKTGKRTALLEVRQRSNDRVLTIKLEGEGSE